MVAVVEFIYETTFNMLEGFCVNYYPNVRALYFGTTRI